MELGRDALHTAAICQADGSAKRRKRNQPKPQPLTRSALDGRTAAAKLFDKLAAEIEIDLGGRNQLSTIERALIEAFVGSCVSLQNLNAKLALCQTIDLSEHASVVSAMVRVASRLGLQRRQKDVSPNLDDIAAEIAANKEQREETAA